MASGSAYASSYLLKEDQMGSSLQAALPVFDQWLGIKTWIYDGELGVKKVKGMEYCCIYDITVELHFPYSNQIWFAGKYTISRWCSQENTSIYRACSIHTCKKRKRIPRTQTANLDELGWVFFGRPLCPKPPNISQSQSVARCLILPG